MLGFSSACHDGQWIFAGCRLWLGRVGRGARLPADLHEGARRLVDGALFLRELRREHERILVGEGGGRKGGRRRQEHGAVVLIGDGGTEEAAPKGHMTDQGPSRELTGDHFAGKHPDQSAGPAIATQTAAPGGTFQACRLVETPRDARSRTCIAVAVKICQCQGTASLEPVMPRPLRPGTIGESGRTI